MAAGRSIAINLFANENVSKAMKKVGDSVKGTESRFEKFHNALKTAALGAGAALAVLAKDSITAASDLSESMSKSNVVFGASAKAVQDFAKTAALSLGQSQQQALEAAGTFGNLFVSMKIGQKESANMSMQLVKLASDLASFNNVSPEEALEALRAGLVGETEPLRRFGINLDDAQMRAETLRLGLGEVGNTLTPLQKAQSAFSLIMKQSTTAQGDFARTSGGLANQQRILKAQFEDTKAALGQQLLPAALAFVKFLNSDMVPMLRSVGQFVSENKTILLTLATVIGVVVAALKVWTVVQGLLNIVMTANPIGLVVVAIAALVAGIIVAYKNSETFRKIVQGTWLGIKQVTLAVWNAALKPVFEGIKWYILHVMIPGYKLLWSVIKTVWGGITSYFKTTWAVWKSIFSGIGKAVGGVRNAFGSAVSYIKKVWGSLTGALQAPINAFISAWNRISGTFNSLRSVVGRLPGFATGGVVPGYATGGVLPGYKPGRDSILAMLSPGEGILRPEAVKALGKGWLDKVNAAAMSGGKGGVKRVLGTQGGAATGVRPAERSTTISLGMDQATVAPTGSGTEIVIRSGGSKMDDMLVQLLRGAIRQRGGNVQTVLGR